MRHVRNFFVWLVIAIVTLFTKNNEEDNSPDYLEEYYNDLIN